MWSLEDCEERVDINPSTREAISCTVGDQGSLCQSKKKFIGKDGFILTPSSETFGWFASTIVNGSGFLYIGLARVELLEGTQFPLSYSCTGPGLHRKLRIGDNIQHDGLYISVGEEIVCVVDCSGGTPFIRFHLGDRAIIHNAIPEDYFGDMFYPFLQYYSPFNMLISTPSHMPRFICDTYEL